MTVFALTLGEPAGPEDRSAPLSLRMLDACLARPLQVTIHPAAWQRVARGRGWVEQLLHPEKHRLEAGGTAHELEARATKEPAAAHDAIYGINTGFGHLKNKRIPADQLEKLQENLLLSHAVGVGPPAPPEIVRWMLLFKIHMLLQGHSGVRPVVIERLQAWLNADLLPVVPTRGSLGASGDLAPLAHLFLPLLGRGELRTSRGTLPAATALAEWNLSPLRLAEKEGLALINGTQFMSAYAVNLVVRAARLVDLADLILCMSLEGLRGSVRPADERLHRLRPHPGAQTAAANVRRHMRDSEILASHAHCDRVQDPYSLRCAPQVHGAFRDALAHVAAVVEREINSVTDNPILFGEGGNVGTWEHGNGEGVEGPRGQGDQESDLPPNPSAPWPLSPSPARSHAPEAISGGNFHGEPLALGLDYLAIALTDLANIAERRVYLLLNGEDGLPKLLMKDTGLNSGFMLPQYTAAALLNECKVLATPASVDSIPTSLGQEDHVSMGATSAVKCFEVLDRAETVLAIEMMCAAQAIDFRAPFRAGVGPRAAHATVRKFITHADADRQFGEDIQTALHLLRHNEELRSLVRAANQ